MGKFSIDKSQLNKIAQIAKGAQYPSEREQDEQTAKNEEVILERTPLIKTDSTEHESAQRADQLVATFKTVIPPTGREVDTQRTRVSPHETKLWEGNPRNFAKKSVSNLVPLIQATNGNTVPVFARYNKEGDIEIIAGSRRRQACNELNKLLTVDIIECNDQEADAIAFMENEGRLDVDAFSNGQFLESRYKMRKSDDPSLTIEQYANSFGVERETMNKYLSIGRLPNALKESVLEHATFSRRSCEKLVSAYKNAAKQIGEDDVLVKVNRSGSFKDCSTLIHFIKKLVNNEPEIVVEPAKKWTVGDAKISFKMKKNGARVIELDSNIDNELLKKLEQLIEKPSN